MIIRACVTNSTYERFYTWYDNNTVVIWRHGMDIRETVRDISTLQRFNEMLTGDNVLPLGSGRKGKISEQ